MERELIHDLANLLGSKIDNRKGNVVIQCPMAPITHAKGTDTDPAMSIKVDAEKQSVVLCFACGTKGTLLRVMTEADEALDGIYSDAVRFIRENDKGGLAGALAALRAGRSRSTAEERLGVPFDIALYVAKCSRIVPDYIVERGLVISDIQRWRIGFDEQMQRAVFPVWDEHGILVGAARRTVLPKEVQWRCLRCNRLSSTRYTCCGVPMRHNPKYHDTPGLPKDSVFYGESFIDPTREHVYLVEGILDAIFASRVLPNVIAIMGANTGIGDARLHKLRRWCRSLTILLDSDQAGNEAWAGRLDHKGRHQPGLRDRLRRHFPVKVAHLPAGEDPASVSPSTLLDAVHGATYLGA